jgi:hypothetical protein
MINIDNIRFGFACNSSSTHTIIVFDDVTKMLPEDTLNCNNYDEYGWQSFVLTTRERKLDYLAVTLWEAIRSKSIPYYVWQFYVNDWLEGVDPTVESKDRSCSRYIENGKSYPRFMDEAKPIGLPTYFNSKFINKEFWEEAKQHILADNVAICGGIDNESYNEKILFVPKDVQAVVSPLSKYLLDEYGVVARKDPKYGHWVCMNGKGTKLRFRFDDKPITSSSLPELVDLKITDYCTKKCGFCYQNSSKEGKHVDYKTILSIVDALADLQVFEIALSGGEPTCHPDFTKILQVTREKGIIPNFTTRNYNWFKNEKNVEVFYKFGGGVAFSVNNVYEVRYVNKIIEYWQLIYPEILSRCSMQCIEGVVPSIEDIVKASCCRVIVLGYKSTGRGKTFEKINNKEDLINIKDNTFRSIGVDTKWLVDHSEEIKDIPDVFTHVKEGMHSMYIDACNLVMAESSYSGVPVDIKTCDGYLGEKYIDRWNIRDQISDFFYQCSSKSNIGDLYDEDKKS